MSTTQSNTTLQANNEKKGPSEKVRTRSPSYPYIDLEEAFSKAKVLYEAEKKNPIPMSSVAKHWNYSEKSSGLKLTVATLKKFGFLTETGTGYVRVSDTAFKIIVDERPDSTERLQLLQDAALSPELYQHLWNKYGADLPSDASLKHHFLVELGFNDRVIDSVINQYKNTISFANLKNTSITPSMSISSPSVQGTSSTMGAGLSANSEIPIFLDNNKFVKIPYPLSEDDYDLMMEQLKVLKKRLVKSDKNPSETE